MKMLRTKQSDQDIEQIGDYIAQDSPRAAVQWVSDIEEKILALASSPGIGRDRSDILQGLRTLAFGNYLICYRQSAKGTELLRVFHGARQWQDLI